MDHDDLPFAQLPTPRLIMRKHDFGEGRYETLSVTEVPERTFQGEWKPRILDLQMFGSEGIIPVPAPTNLSAQSARQLLDEQFSLRFADHQCTSGCMPWTRLSGQGEAESDDDNEGGDAPGSVPPQTIQ
jgi:hypothetical protein